MRQPRPQAEARSKHTDAHACVCARARARARAMSGGPLYISSLACGVAALGSACPRLCTIGSRREYAIPQARISSQFVIGLRLPSPALDAPASARTHTCTWKARGRSGVLLQRVVLLRLQPLLEPLRPRQRDAAWCGVHGAARHPRSLCAELAEPATHVDESIVRHLWEVKS